MNDACHDALGLRRAGKLSSAVTLMRLIFAGLTESEIDRILSDSPADADLLDFFQSHRTGLPRLRAMAERVNHLQSADPPAIAAMFDAALEAAPEASVAAYSLGDPALLAAATGELVQWLWDMHFFAPGMDVLDLGCGFGRIAGALASKARSMLGLDVSPGMIAEANRRFTAPNLQFCVTSGGDLRDLGNRSFDLILAVDSFPYLMQAGTAVARCHLEESARLLRGGGGLVLLNLSYGPDPHADAARVTRWAEHAGLRADCLDIQPFHLWDAHAFVFRRPAVVHGGNDLVAPRPDVAWQQPEDSR